MNKKRIVLLFAAILMFWAQTRVSAQGMPWAAGQSRGQDLIIKLVTFGPGDDIPSFWGHTALIVEDTLRQKARIYNFGLFSFDQKMVVRFLMGRLIFSGGASQVPSYLLWYKKLNRDVRIATLDIPGPEKKELAARLAWNVLPENKDYLYHHYYENCSTRLRDFLNDALHGKLYEATRAASSFTLRDLTRRYVGRSPALEMLLMFLMSDQIDQPIRRWDEMFLPDELEHYVKSLSYSDSTGKEHSLVSDYTIYYRADRPSVPAGVPRHEPGALLLGLLLGCLPLIVIWWKSVAFNAWADVAFGAWNFLIGLGLGIPGLALLLMALFTDHTVVYYNENLLLANPLTIVLIPAGAAWALEKRWARRWLPLLWYVHLIGLAILLLLKFLPAFDQDNLLVLLFIGPVIAGGALSAWLAAKKHDLSHPTHFKLDH